MCGGLYLGDVKHWELLMELCVIPFNQLTVYQLHAIYRLRAKVFVVEQKCAYQDIDEKDLLALHVLGYNGSQLVAYARLLPAGVSYNIPAIGRVVVDPDFRNRDFGKILMKYCLQQTIQVFDCKEIKISAQSYLQRFYEELGFTFTGKEYLEDEIPHMEMMYRE
jgi:ElaA protein